MWESFNRNIYEWLTESLEQEREYQLQQDGHEILQRGGAEVGKEAEYLKIIFIINVKE